MQDAAESIGELVGGEGEGLSVAGDLPEGVVEPPRERERESVAAELGDFATDVGEGVGLDIQAIGLQDGVIGGEGARGADGEAVAGEGFGVL